MKNRIKLFLFLILLAVTFNSYAVEGYPGATWGTVNQELSGIEGLSTQGWIRQGVRWFSFANTDFETYISGNWRKREKNNKYYNSQGLGLNFIFVRKYINYGLDYYITNYDKLSETENYLNLFISWYRLWHWKYLSEDSIGLPFSTWGRIDRDLKNIEGFSFMGWIKQGIDWYRFKNNWILNTYFSYNWRLRTQNEDYYNALGPTLGVEIYNSIFDLGIEYSWRNYTKLNETENSLNLFIRWYYEWDLKNRM